MRRRRPPTRIWWIASESPPNALGRWRKTVRMRALSSTVDRLSLSKGAVIQYSPDCHPNQRSMGSAERQVFRRDGARSTGTKRGNSCIFVSSGMVATKAPFCALEPGSMAKTSPKTSPKPELPSEVDSDAARPFAVIDMGASAIRLLVAEVTTAGELKMIEEASRGVLLGKDTFTHGKLSPATMEATLKALEGFRRIMDSYGVVHYRAVATSAVREAENSDTFIDRIRLRTGLNVEIIDGSEENRLTYVAVRAMLRTHEALVASDALLV